MLSGLTKCLQNKVLTQSFSKNLIFKTEDNVPAGKLYIHTGTRLDLISTRFENYFLKNICPEIFYFYVETNTITIGTLLRENRLDNSTFN